MITSASQILNQTTVPTDDKKSGDQLGKNDFLKLLVIQLQYQDPLNPMEDKEFVAQMAQFTSLEQLTNINQGITTLTDGNKRQELLSAVSFMGKSVLAKGDSVSKLDGALGTVYYTIEDAAQEVSVNIFDKNGQIVRTLERPAQKAGTYQLTWDGKDFNGKDVADGVYSVGMAALDKNGNSILVDMQVTGQVVGVQKDDKTNYLVLNDGRKVNFLDVQQIANPKDTTAQ